MQGNAAQGDTKTIQFVPKNRLCPNGLRYLGTCLGVPREGLGIALRGWFFVHFDVRGGPLRSRGVQGVGLGESPGETGQKISSQTAFKYGNRPPAVQWTGKFVEAPRKVC